MKLPKTDLRIVPACRSCWQSRHPDNIEPLTVRVEFRRPEFCHWCNQKTVSGIYTKVTG